MRFKVGDSLLPCPVRGIRGQRSGGTPGGCRPPPERQTEDRTQPGERPDGAFANQPPQQNTDSKDGQAAERPEINGGKDLRVLLDVQDEIEMAQEDEERVRLDEREQPENRAREFPEVDVLGEEEDRGGLQDGGEIGVALEHPADRAVGRCHVHRPEEMQQEPRETEQIDRDAAFPRDLVRRQPVSEQRIQQRIGGHDRGHFPHIQVDRPAESPLQEIDRELCRHHQDRPHDDVAEVGPFLPHRGQKRDRQVDHEKRQEEPVDTDDGRIPEFVDEDEKRFPRNDMPPRQMSHRQDAASLPREERDPGPDRPPDEILLRRVFVPVVHQRRARDHEEDRDREIEHRLDEVGRDPQPAGRMTPEDAVRMEHDDRERGYDREEIDVDAGVNG